jgi:hypothetical protein
MTAAELGRRLVELWATLDALGATVHRRPIAHLRAVTLRPMVAAAAERVRVLTSPEAAARVLRGAA